MNWNATSTAEIAADLLRATLAASGGARNPQVPISTLRLLRAGGRTQRVARYGLRRFQSNQINRTRQRFGEPATAQNHSEVPGARHAGRVRRCSQSSGTDQYIAVAARSLPRTPIRGAAAPSESLATVCGDFSARR